MIAAYSTPSLQDIFDGVSAPLPSHPPRAHEAAPQVPPDGGPRSLLVGPAKGDASSPSTNSLTYIIRTSRRRSAGASGHPGYEICNELA